MLALVPVENFYLYKKREIGISKIDETVKNIECTVGYF